MISVHLMGGLGNQMFQYAFGKKISLMLNTKLQLNISSYNNDKLRTYDLDIFKNIIEDCTYNKYGQEILEPHFHYSNILNKINLYTNDIYLFGFWQSYKYFEDINDIIKKLFIFKNDVLINSKDLLNKINTTNSIAINIRRTDYLNTNFHGVMGVEYIMNGVNIIENKIKNPRYFIFSDDIVWCKENLKIPNSIIVDHSHKGYKFDNYLNLMSNCKHFIIPNSTFAWWGSWLSNNVDKIIITPKKWFNNTNINTQDLIPTTWIKI